MIVYDGDPSRIYSFRDFDKVMASVEASIRGYVGEDDGFERVYSKVMALVKEREHQQCIPIRVHGLHIVIYHWELDDKHPVHQVLRECYDVVSPPLKTKIASLFFDSRHD